MRDTTDRRQFLRMGFTAAALLPFAGCGSATDAGGSGDARLGTRPRAATSPRAPGVYDLNISTGTRDGFLFIPAAAAAGPVPLLTMLHGAGFGATEFNYLQPIAEQRGFAMFTPDSRASSWDFRTGIGPDVAYIDRALNDIFGMVRVDPDRVAIAGFSDGGAYAITLGLANGDLFHHVMSFSPSAAPRFLRNGTPPIFVAHGTADAIIPVETSRDVIVPQLRASGYSVTYLEFQGTHSVPIEIANAAFDWWAAT